jgi:4-amino-4-deoxy-L-arabinose transferase-like glycosyltransferase
MQEPSLLDFLVALIDPRKERIPIPPRPGDPLTAEDQDGASTDLVQGEAETLPEFSLEDTLPEPPSDAARQEPGVGLPEIIEDAAGSLPDTREVPRAAEGWAGAMVIPWRTISALILALTAQASLEPPERLLIQGILLYGLALGLLVWAYLVGELALTPLPASGTRRDPLTVDRTRVLIAAGLSLAAFFLFGGNQFNLLNLTALAAAFFYLAWSLRLPGAAPIGAGLLARLREWRQISIRPWHLAVIGVSLLVLFFRFYQLEQVPPQMFSDHAEKLQDVKDILDGDPRIFFPRNTGREAVQMYLTAFVAKYLGVGLTFMSLKLGTALAGLLTIPYIYLLGKELGNRRVGLMAAGLAGISYWLNVITRVALRFSLYPLFAAPTLYYLVRGLRHGRRSDFVWAGIFLGLGLHGYSPFRFVPFVVLAALFLYLLHKKSSALRVQAVWLTGILVSVSTLVFLPLLRYVLEDPAHWQSFSYRAFTRMTDVEQALPGGTIQVFVQNFWKAMTMFAWDNGETWVHSVVHRPALDVATGALFYLGFMLVLVRYLRRKNWEDGFLLLSIPLLMMPSILSLAFPVENPSLNRTSGAIIPVFILAAVMFDSLLKTLESRVGGRPGRVAAWTAGLVLLMWSVSANFDLIFNQYFRQFEAASWNTTELGGVIRGFADSIGDENNAWVIPWPHWVDTRLVGINAGVPIKDYAVPRERLPETQGVSGPKLFLFKLEDSETLQVLESLYPQGSLKRFDSAVEGKDFYIYSVPGDARGIVDDAILVDPAGYPPPVPLETNPYP